MKYLGIDFGSKRIGIAVSDDNGTLAFPHTIFPNTKHTILEIKTLIELQNIGGIVIGESTDQNGNLNDIATSAKAFGIVLEGETNIPVFFEKEFFTSFEAHDRQGKERNNARKVKIEKTEMLDARAAALILQRYLDKKKQNLQK